MSYDGQAHHPHTAGTPPNHHLLDRSSSAPDHSLSPYIPHGLELVHASWFIRHGERSPVRQRLVGVGSIPPYFPLCSIGRDFSAAVLAFTSPSSPAPAATSEGAPPPPEGLLPAVSRADVEKSTMEVRRVTEDPAGAARGVRGGLRD
ncbi:hypothetical protein JCM8097_000723, partial [Rhodosporidiobolus ruineniae]